MLHFAVLVDRSPFRTAAWRLRRPFRQSGLLPDAGSVSSFDLREVRGRLVILVLRPALEGMVVALVAVEANAQEQMRGVFHRRFGITQHLEVAGRGIFLVRSGGRQDLVCELVIGSILGNGRSNPIAERLASLDAQEFAIDL